MKSYNMLSAAVLHFAAISSEQPQLPDYTYQPRSFHGIRRVLLRGTYFIQETDDPTASSCVLHTTN